MIDFKFADIGEGIHEGKIIKWMVKAGDMVKDGDTLFTVETDKITAEIPSPSKGKIVELLAEEGDIIHVGQVVVKIDDGSTNNHEAIDKPKKEMVEEGEEQSAGVVGELMVSSQVIEQSIEVQESLEARSQGKILATPVARKLAKDLNIDIQKVKGTGPVGRILKEDIYKMKEKMDGVTHDSVTIEPIIQKPSELKITGLVERVPLTMLRKTIAKNMALSNALIPHAAAMDEIDVTELVKFRNAAKVIGTEHGVKLTYMPFIIKALILTLKEHPVFNGSYDVENGEMVLKKYYNIGIATDTPDGLIVPVVKNANQRSIFEIADEVERLSEAARNKKLSMEDIQDGTFSITNYGAVGTGSGIPVIKHPEVAILGIGNIMKKPVVLDGEIAIRDIMTITLCIDHRVIDGGDSGRFIKRFKEFISNPTLMLLVQRKDLR